MFAVQFLLLNVVTAKRDYLYHSITALPIAVSSSVLYIQVMRTFIPWTHRRTQDKTLGEGRMQVFSPTGGLAHVVWEGRANFCRVTVLL